MENIHSNYLRFFEILIYPITSLRASIKNLSYEKLKNKIKELEEENHQLKLVDEMYKISTTNNEVLKNA